MKRYLAAAFAVFLVYLVWDNFIGSFILGSTLAQIPGMVPEFSKLWEIVGDAFAALVLVGLYARTRSVFGSSVAGGAVYGVYAGLLINFPTWLFMTVYAGWPYGATWLLTIVAVLLTIFACAVMGGVYQMMERPATT